VVILLNSSFFTFFASLIFSIQIFAETLKIDDSFQRESSEKYLTYIKEGNYIFKPQEIFDMNLKKAEKSFFGFQNGFFWTKFSIENISKTSQNLVIYNFVPEMSFIEISIFKNGAYVKTIQTGFSKSQEEAEQFYRLPMLNFTINPNEKITFVSKIKNLFLYNLGWEILKIEKFLVEDNYRNMLLTFFGGLATFFTFLTLLLFFAYKEVTFIYISLFAISSVIFHFSFQGLIYLFDIGLNAESITTLTWVSAILCNLFPFLYSYKFFDVKNYKKISFLLKLNIYYFLLLIPILFHLILSDSTAIFYISQYSIVISFLTMTLLFFVSIFMTIKKELGAIYFMFGQGAVSLSFFFYILALFGILPYTEDIQFIMPFTGVFFILTTMYSQYLKTKERFVQIQKKKDFLLQQSRFSAMGQAIGSISHQWKEPLSSLSGSVAVLETSFIYQKENFEMYFQQELPVLKKSIDLMAKTINEFSTYYKGRDIPENFSTTKTINNILSILKTRIVTANTEIKIKNDVEILNSYEHIFSNIVLVLISNSLDEFINLKLQDKKQDNLILIQLSKIENRVTLHYKDNAGGIKLNPIEQVFEYFITTKDTEGMGLPIAKMLIEDRLHGLIKVSNTENGAYFYIEFPVI
jgi:signal transduction histidine kinase